MLQATGFVTGPPYRRPLPLRALTAFVQGAFDAYAMGNFPFATDYMTGEGQGELPAWPMRAACERMSSLAPAAATHSDTSTQPPAGRHSGAHSPRLGRKGLLGWVLGQHTTEHPQAAAGHVAAVGQVSQEVLLGRLASAASLLYNASGTASCFSLGLAGPAAGSVGAWDYQVRRST